MNKTELIKAIATETGLKKMDVSTSVDAVISVVSNALKNGEKIQLTGFGTFEVVDRPARECRNPQNGEPVMVEAKKAPKFKPGKALKDYINS